MPAAAALLLALAAGASAAPVRVIFDTDMGNDVDDALALSILHSLEHRGEAKLLAVTITKDNRYAAPFVDIVNTFYGRGDIPIGVVRNGKTPADSNMIRVPVERGGYPHDLTDGREAPEAVSLLRRILAREAAGAVTIVQVGFSTNLARLLDSPPDDASPLNGRDLVRRKVRLLSVMAGAFPEGKPEYNVKTDIPAARKVFAEWPTPAVFSGYEIGLSMLYPASSIEQDFGPRNPVSDAYRSYKPMPYDRPTWDLTSAMYAVRPGRYFSLSPAGEITVDDEGRTHFAPNPKAARRYLVVTEAQRAALLKDMIRLASWRPGARSAR